MRGIVIVVFVALLGAGLSACCDCQQVIDEKQQRIASLEAHIAGLEAKLTEIHAAEPADEQPAAAAAAKPTDLAACIERLKACELDPFKGGKYFSPEKVDPSCDKPAGADGLKDPFAVKKKKGDPPAKGEPKDPFKGKPQAEPAKGAVKDPFSKK